MKNYILSWNDVKQRYLEFHRMDSFTENMAIDIDFGYWLVNNCIIPDVVKSLPNDEEVKAYIDTLPYYGTCTTEYNEGFEDGIKWRKGQMSKTRKHNQRIEILIADKKDEELANKSVEELEKMLKD